MIAVRRRNSQRNCEVLEGRRLLSGYQSLFRKGHSGEGEAPAEPVSAARAARQEPRPPTSGDELVGMPQRPGGSTRP
jgi:hypothetical protein